MKLTEDEYLEAVDAMEGYCTHCKELTRYNTEGDAEGYDCPKCERNTVMGVENALMSGLLDVR